MKQSQQRFHLVLRRWLSEESSEFGSAPESLAEVFQQLPPVAPSAEFSGRVLRRLGLATAGESKARYWIFRLAAALSMLMGGGAVWLAVQSSSTWAPLAGGGRIINWSTAALIGLSERAADGLAVWNVLTRVAETLAWMATSPQFFAALAICTAASYGALRALVSLLTVERRTVHA